MAVDARNIYWKSLDFRGGKKVLWMAVSSDEFELPFAVEETADKLAKKMKTTKNNIVSKKCRGNKGIICGYKVVTVDGR